MEGNLIQDLVTRLCKELPVNSQELRPNLQTNTLKAQNEQALVEVSAYKLNHVASNLTAELDKLLKQTTTTEDDMKKLVLSQMYLLDLLGKCLEHQWEHIRAQLKDTEGLDESEVAILKQKQEGMPPPPLEEKLASTMFRQVNHFLTSKNLPTYELAKIQQLAARVLFQLSASNYENLIANITQYLTSQSGVSEEESLAQIGLIEHLNLNGKHLSQLLEKVASVSNQKKSSNIHVPIAKALRKAIWNWIDNYPMEFVALCKSGGRLPGNPDKLFDVFNSWASSTTKKQNFWPLCTMLLILCPDIMLKVALDQNTVSKEDQPKEAFLEALKKSLKSSKLADVSAVCYVDICKASTYVSKQDMSALRYLVPAIETELKEKLFNPASPFKGSDGQVDEGLMVDCLLSVFLLSPRKVMNSLFVDCLNESNPALFRRVLVRTLLRLGNSTHLPWNPKLSDMYSIHSGNLRQLFQNLLQSMRQYNATKGQTDKKSRALLDKYTVDMDILVSLIDLFRVDPVLALYPLKTSTQDLEDIRQLLTGLVACVAQLSNPAISSTACQALRQLHKPENIARWCLKNVVDGFWEITSSVNSDLAKLLVERDDLSQEHTRVLLLLVEDILGKRNQFIANSKADIAPNASTKQVRFNASNALETALLINLNTENTQLVSVCANCLGYLCEEVDVLRHCIEDSDNSIVTNFDAYKQLSTGAVLSTGRQAQQKAIRTRLRRVERQTPGNTAAWETIYRRYQNYAMVVTLNEQEAQITDPKNVKAAAKGKGQASQIPKHLAVRSKMEVQVEFTNFLGMLCSLSGVTLGLERKVEVQAAMKGKKAAPGASKVINVQDEFIEHMIANLNHEVVKIRETTKMMLGNTLAPAAYSVLFRQLLTQTKKVFGSSGQVDFSAATTLFVDQTISILKLILEADHKSDDLSLLTDLQDLVLILIRFVRQLTLSVGSLQTKHKLCGMLEAMMHKSNMLSIPNEHQFRTDLVESIMEWTSEFSAKESNIPADLPPAQQKQMGKLIKELDVQAMRAISALLRGCALQGKDDEAKSSNFSKFFTFFTHLLTRCKKNPSTVLTPQLPEATIESLSYLVTANIEHGLEYFVTMGYHEDGETRSAFLKVLSNILKEGTEFSMGDENVDKYYKLLELVMDSRLDAVLALCDVTQITEADAVALLLVRVFEANDKTLDLLKACINQEVQKTDSANTLFRRNSMATKLLAAYCKLIGQQYLQDCLGKQLRAIMQETPEIEMDPAKLLEGQNIFENQKRVQKYCENFLADITASLPVCPAPFREICNFLHQAVSDKFPGAEHTAVAGFMFLRYLCPAIVAPDGYRVISHPIADPNVRRCLVLVTKVMQNLANRVLFTKEPFMHCMNEHFLEGNMEAMRNLLDSYCELVVDAPSSPLTFDEEQKEDDMGTLHYYFSGSLEKLRSLWTSPQFVGKATPLDKLTSVLSQLGPPPEPSKNKDVKSFGGRAPGGKSKNIHYEKFMKHMANRNTDGIQSKDIFFQKGKTKMGIPVLYYVARNFTSSVEPELLNYYLLKTIQPFISKKFSLVIDLSMVSADNQIQANWAASLVKVMPNQVGENIDAVYFLHANLFFKKYSKRIAKFTSRVQKKFIFCSSTSQLAEYIPQKELGLPSETLSIETNVQSTFSPVTRVTQYNKKDVTLRIGTDFLIVETDKKNPVFGHQTTLVEIIHISRINEISAQQRKDSEQFVVKYEDNAQRSMQLYSSSSEQIIQQLTASKDRYNLSRPQNTIARSKAFRPSDVPGTLLNMALLNMTAAKHELRVAAYNLLVSLCASFSFSVSSNLLEATDIAIPKNCTEFVVGISGELAQNEPSMTLEFLLESLHGITKTDKIGQILVLDYIRPWLVNLASLEDSKDDAAKVGKFKDLFNALIALTIREHAEIEPDVLSKIWSTIGNVPEVLTLVLECVFEMASHPSSSPLGTKNMDCFEDVVGTIAAENPPLVAGALVQHVISLLHQTGEQDFERIEKHPKWVDIEVSIRLLLTLSYDNLICVQHYLPELFYIILMVFYTGDNLIRTNVHALFINIVHSLLIGRVCHEDKMQTLRFHLNDFHQPQNRLHFGIGGNRSGFGPYQRSNDRDDKLEVMNINMVENVANSMFAVLNCCTSHATCIATDLHERWLTLTHAAAFLPNPHIQPRAIATLGSLCLSPSLVTDELVGKLLNLLRVSLFASTTGANDLAVSIILCFSRLIEQLHVTSKYFKPFFWISMSLVQIHDTTLFAASVQMLEAVVKTLYEHDCYKAQGLAAFCTQLRRGRLEPTLQKLDSLTGISFETHFAFGVASHLLKGLKNASTKAVTARALSSLVDLCKESNPANMLGYLAALLPHKGDDIGHLRQTIIAASGDAGNASLWNVNMIPDLTHAALLNAFLSTILKSSEFEHEQLFIYKSLEEGVNFMPEAIPVTFDVLIPKMQGAITSSQNAELQTSVLAITHWLFAFGLESTTPTSKFSKQHLQTIGFGGLPEADHFNTKLKAPIIQIVCNILDSVLVPPQ